jgi:hypothetical protein
MSAENLALLATRGEQLAHLIIDRYLSGLSDWLARFASQALKRLPSSNGERRPGVRHSAEEDGGTTFPRPVIQSILDCGQRSALGQKQTLRPDRRPSLLATAR